MTRTNKKAEYLALSKRWNQIYMALEFAKPLYNQRYGKLAIRDIAAWLGTVGGEMDSIDRTHLKHDDEVIGAVATNLHSLVENLSNLQRSSEQDAVVEQFEGEIDEFVLSKSGSLGDFTPSKRNLRGREIVFSEGGRLLGPQMYIRNKSSKEMHGVYLAWDTNNVLTRLSYYRNDCCVFDATFDPNGTIKTAERHSLPRKVDIAIEQPTAVEATKPSEGPGVMGVFLGSAVAVLASSFLSKKLRQNKTAKIEQKVEEKEFYQIGK